MFTKSKLADARSRKKKPALFSQNSNARNWAKQNKNSPHTQIADICHRQNADYRRFFDFFSTRACVLSDSKREKKKKKTYQSVSRLVLVQGAHSGPVEGLQQLDAGRVERVLTGHDAEEVGVALAGEHRVRVRVRQLQSNNHVSLLFPSRFVRLPPPPFPVRRYICRHSIRGAKFKFFKISFNFFIQF